MILTYLILTLFHPYHVSVCDIVLPKEGSSLQITHRIFSDDLQDALYQFSDSSVDLKNKNAETNKALAEYLNLHFSMTIEGGSNDLEFVGFELEDDLVWCYLESAPINGTEKITVKNSILTSSFDDQQNILHFKFPDHKKSFILKKGKAEASYTN